MSSCAHCGGEFVANATPWYCDPCCGNAQIRCGQCNKFFLPRPPEYPFAWCPKCAAADPALVPLGRLPGQVTLDKQRRQEQAYWKVWKDTYQVTEEDRQRFAAQAEQAKEAKEAKDKNARYVRAEVIHAQREEKEKFLREAKEREQRRERKNRRSAIDYLRRLYVRLCRQAIVTGKASRACLTARQIYVDAVEERYKLIGKLNDRIWRQIHNLEEAEGVPAEAKPHAAPVPEAVDDWDDEEDWRPLFLRSHGLGQRDEDLAEDAGRYLDQWLPLWRERFELLQVRLLEEQDDERSAEAWAPADEEPQERPKITDALLKTFNNQWQPRLK